MYISKLVFKKSFTVFTLELKCFLFALAHSTKERPGRKVRSFPCTVVYEISAVSVPVLPRLCH